MSKIAVVYWSGTGNTKAMADLIAEGAKEAGAEAKIFTSGEFEPDMVSEYDGLAFGCPSMGAEVLEEEEFEPMFDACRSKLKDKKIALFGSYGWGDGEWMRNWQEDCLAQGAEVFDTVICVEAPDDKAEEACKVLGWSLSKVV